MFDYGNLELKCNWIEKMLQNRKGTKTPPCLLVVADGVRPVLGLAELGQVLEGVPDLPRADQEVHHRLLVVVILTEAEIKDNHLSFNMHSIYILYFNEDHCTVSD